MADDTLAEQAIAVANVISILEEMLQGGDNSGKLPGLCHAYPHLAGDARSLISRLQPWAADIQRETDGVPDPTESGIAAPVEQLDP